MIVITPHIGAVLDRLQLTDPAEFAESASMLHATCILHAVESLESQRLTPYMSTDPCSGVQ